MRSSGTVFFVARVWLGLTAASVSVASAGEPITIVTLGGGFLNGFGVDPEETIPARLAAALKAEGRSVTVKPANAMESKAGLTWLMKWKAGKELLARPANHAVILELGPSDCYSDSESVDGTRANIDQVLALLAEHRIPVLFIGTKALDDCPVKSDYRDAYAELFSDLAKKYDELFYPDFLDGVRGHADLTRKGYDDPNGQGNALIAEQMLPLVRELLVRVEQSN